jgi:ML-like domain
MIESSSLNPCQAQNNLSATLFNVVFTPDNRTVTFDVVGLASIQGNVMVDLELLAYGYSAIKQTIDPCKEGYTQLCPLNTGQLDINSNFIVGADVVNQIPGK